MRNWFNQRFCLHTYGPWQLGIRVLKSWMGTTEDEIQERFCTACAFRQRAEIQLFKAEK